MPTPPLTDETLRETRIALKQCGGSIRATAKHLGIGRNALKNRLRHAEARGIEGPYAEFSTPPLPSGEMPIEELLEMRERESARIAEREKALELVPVQIKTPGPIGIALFGDPHIDDPGCDFARLREHTELVRNTEGLFAACVGDLQNGWIGRLTYKYADQQATARQAWQLVEWWVEQLAPWMLWIVEGNHDLWVHGINRLSPLNWIKNFTYGLVEPDALSLALHLPDVVEPYTFLCRHQFKGNSQWNETHGIAKAAQMGRAYDVLCAGHFHKSGYQMIKHPMSGRVSHCVQIASYKIHDPYARSLDFADKTMFECPVMVIDPSEPDERYRVTFHPNPVEGARVLTWKRGEWAANRA